MSCTMEVPFCCDIEIFYMSWESSKATFILEMLLSTISEIVNFL